MSHGSILFVAGVAVIAIVQIYLSRDAEPAHRGEANVPIRPDVPKLAATKSSICRREIMRPFQKYDK
jgi:hypothetical protein